ncbi:MAG: hypothetical protein J6U54_24570 [Clostridiales bacterium]|nr:hypothetical protein [Clostridiales bacterium]
MLRITKKNLITRIKRRVDDKDINVSLIATSIVANTIMAFCKVGFGVYLNSIFLIMHALYFIVLGIARYRTMRNYIYCKTIKDEHKRYEKEFDIHNRSGSFIFIIGFSYLALCLRMYFVGDVILIGGVLVYWFILFALAKNTFAIYGVVITWNKADPMIRVMKVIGIVDSLLSIVPVLYTSLSYFQVINSAELPSAIGIIISLCVMVSGVIMSNRRKEYYVKKMMK